MKKSLVALAALAAVSAASAQSTVTLFGGIDLNLRSVKSGDNKFQGMAQDGTYSSRFGVRGVEDLGGGLSGQFHLEGGLNPDTGTPGGLTFLRKSTLGLAGGFGEVRLGRDYTPLFLTFGIADPFGTNGLGSSLNMMGSTVVATSAAEAAVLGRLSTFATGAGATTAFTQAAGIRTTSQVTLADPNAVRASNSIAYHSPKFGGFDGSLMYSFGAENTGGLRNQGEMTSLRLGYAAGPVAVAFANQITRGGVPANAAALAATATTPAVPATTGTDDQKWTTNQVAASYNFGFAKLSAMYRTERFSFPGDSLRLKSWLLGATAPFGPAVLKASFIDKRGEDEKLGTQIAVGVDYSLSKRTAMYSTYSVLKNRADTANSIGSVIAFPNERARGLEVGVRHIF